MFPHAQLYKDIRAAALAKAFEEAFQYEKSHEYSTWFTYNKQFSSPSGDGITSGYGCSFQAGASTFGDNGFSCSTKNMVTDQVYGTHAHHYYTATYCQ